MEARHRKPGSVRLTDEQYEEMDRMGIDNESAYVKYKLSTAQSKLAILKTPLENSQLKTLPVFEDKLTIQRLVMENQGLKSKLEEFDQNTQNTLSGVNQKVHSMLQDELMKRDYESLKESHSQRKKQIDELEKNLKDAKKETESKQEEIEALVKKLGLVELGKALLPGAISGLAKQYPNQMQGIAGTLGSLGLSHNMEDDNLNEEQNNFIQILKYLQEVFTEAQFEQIIQLIIQIGEQTKEDDTILKKIGYYLNQLQEKKEATQ